MQKLSEEKLFKASFKRMGSVFEKEFHPLPLFVEEKPLQSACRIAAEAMGISVALLPLPESPSLQSLIEWFGRSAASRPVELREGWWKSITSSMVVFYGKQQRPMAIVRSGGEALLVDPESERSVKLTAGLAASIHPVAFSFYRSFPKRLKNWRERIGFAVKPALSDFPLLIIAGFLSGICALAIPFSNQILFDLVVPNIDLTLYWQLVIGLLFISCSYLAFDLVQSFLILRFRGLVENHLQAALWERLLHLPARFFRLFGTGDLIQRLTFVEQVRPIILTKALDTFIEAPFALLYLVLMFYYSPSLTWVVIGIIALITLVFWVAVNKLLPLSRAVLHQQGKLQTFLVQLAKGIAKLRITASEKRAFAYWAEGFSSAEEDAYAQAGIEMVLEWIRRLFAPLILGVMYAVILYWGVHGESAFSLGRFLAFQSAVMLFAANYAELMNSILSFIHVIPYWERTRVLLKAEPEQQGHKRIVRSLEGHVRFENVTFHYPGTSTPVIHDLSFSCQPGSFTGIVGASGSGKSTLFRLLLGLETPDAGSIYYDSYDLSELDLDSLRRQVGSVLQTSHLFSCSIKENILLGRNTTQKELEYALQISCFDEVLERLPMGLDTLLPSCGSTLSGGERQRLLLARALISRPSVLLLDEATSALDVLTQERVQSRIDEVKITRLVIAHRLETLQRADRLLYTR